MSWPDPATLIHVCNLVIPLSAAVTILRSPPHDRRMLGSFLTLVCWIGISLSFVPHLTLRTYMMSEYSLAVWCLASSVLDVLFKIRNKQRSAH